MILTNRSLKAEAGNTTVQEPQIPPASVNVPGQPQQIVETDPAPPAPSEQQWHTYNPNSSG